MMTMITMSMIVSIYLPMMKHPLSMGMILIIQTILVSITTGLIANTFWFSYILIISMLSGALVLFIYMASIASNEKFKLSIPLLMTTIPTTLLTTLSLMFVDQMKTSSIWSTNKKHMMVNDQIMTLNKLFNMHNMSTTILLVTYLFITMIAVTFVTSVNEGPLRTKS